MLSAALCPGSTKTLCDYASSSCNCQENWIQRNRWKTRGAPSGRVLYSTSAICRAGITNSTSNGSPPDQTERTWRERHKKNEVQAIVVEGNEIRGLWLGPAPEFNGFFCGLCCTHPPASTSIHWVAFAQSCQLTAAVFPSTLEMQWHLCTYSNKKSAKKPLKYHWSSHEVVFLTTSIWNVSYKGFFGHICPYICIYCMRCQMTVEGHMTSLLLTGWRGTYGQTELLLNLSNLWIVTVFSMSIFLKVESSKKYCSKKKKKVKLFCGKTQTKMHLQTNMKHSTYGVKKK